MQFLFTLVTIVLSITFAFTGSITAAETEVPFLPGEKLVFEVKWKFIPAGEAVLEVLPLETISGVKHYHFVMKAKTYKYIDPLYKVRDRIDAYTDLKMTYSKLYKKNASIEVIIDAMDLNDQKNKLYMNLSGGLKQRVGVAIALVNDPDIIFLDEPTTGLDPKARREVWEVIADLRDRGKTIFLTTHYMEEAEYLADHIAIIHKGKIIAEGSLDDLINRYGQGSILHIKNCKTKDVVNILKDNDFNAEKKGNGNIAIKIENKERVLEVLSFFRHECIDYDSIDIGRSNLEEVFLNLTGAKLSEGE